MSYISFLFPFVTSKFYFFSVFYNNIIPTINMWGKIWLIFTSDKIATCVASLPNAMLEASTNNHFFSIFEEFIDFVYKLFFFKLNYL